MTKRTSSPHAATAWNSPREYLIPADLLKAGAVNTIAVRVFDSGGAGGLTGGTPLLIGGDDTVRVLTAWQVRPGDDAAWAAPDAGALTALAAASTPLAPNARVMQGAPVRDHTLWYEQPAATWNEALPVGNGRLVASACENGRRLASPPTYRFDTGSWRAPRAKRSRRSRRS